MTDIPNSTGTIRSRRRIRYRPTLVFSVLRPRATQVARGRRELGFLRIPDVFHPQLEAGQRRHALDVRLGPVRSKEVDLEHDAGVQRGEADGLRVRLLPCHRVDRETERLE